MAAPEAGRPRPWSRWVWMGLALTIAVGVLGWLVYRERELLLAYDWRIRWQGVALAFVCYTAAIAGAAGIWVGMLRAMGASDLPPAVHFYYLSLSNLAKRLPGTIWYVIGRSQLYKQNAVPARVVVAASGLELGVSVVSGVAVSLCFAWPLIGEFGVSPWWQVLFLAGLAGLLQPRLLRWALARFGMEAAEIGYGKLLSWVGGYALIWLIGGAMLLGIANIFVYVDIGSVWYFIGAWALVGSISSSMFFFPSNLGVTEVGLGVLLSNVMPGPMAVLAALFVRITTILFEAIWFLIAYLILRLSGEEVSQKNT